MGRDDSSGQVCTAAGGVNLTDNNATLLIAAPTDAAQALAVFFFSAINRHATVATTFELFAGNTGTGIIVYCAAAGGGFAGALPQPLLLPPGTALNGKCGTTGADVVVSVLAEKVKG